jgi:hypothetical protein
MRRAIFLITAVSNACGASIPFSRKAGNRDWSRLSIVRAIQVRKPKRLKQATGHVHRTD